MNDITLTLGDSDSNGIWPGATQPSPHSSGNIATTQATQFTPMIGLSDPDQAANGQTGFTDISNDQGANVPGVIVGQLLTLASNTGSAPAALNVTFGSWTVQDCEAGFNSGATGGPVPLTAADKQNPTITFAYTSTGSMSGTPETVQYTFKIGGVAHTVTGTILVFRPTTTESANQRKPELKGNDLSDTTIFFQTLQLPSGFQGTVEWAQLVEDLSDNITRELNGVNQQYHNLSVAPGLDNRFPYPYDPKLINHGLNILDTDDEPGLLIDSSDKVVTWSISLSMYLLFVPHGDSSICVPMQVINWKTSATVERFSSGLKLMVESPSKQIPLFGENTIYPTWDRVVTGDVTFVPTK